MYTGQVAGSTPVRLVMFETVIPVAGTQPSWNLFIKLCQSVNGESPCLGIDAANIKRGPSTFAQCIDLKNTPYAALREYNPHLAHISFVFMVKGDDDFHLNLISVREIIITSPAAGVFYVSAALDQWQNIIRRVLARPLPEYNELQRFLSVVYGIFRSIGFKDLWIGLTPEDQSNNITLLK